MGPEHHLLRGRHRPLRVELPQPGQARPRPDADHRMVPAGIERRSVGVPRRPVAAGPEPADHGPGGRPAAAGRPRTRRSRVALMAQQLYMPRLSQDMTQGRIVKWLAEEGEAVKAGEPLVSVETDKAV